MLRWLLRSCTALAALLLLGGCGASLARKIHVEEVVDLRTYGTSGADLTLLVCNESRRAVSLEAACMEFFEDSVLLGRARLQRAVVIPKRSCEEVRSRWRNESADAAGWYLLEKRLREHELDRLTVSGAFEVRVGGVRRTICWDRVPVSNFLNIFAPDQKEPDAR